MADAVADERMSGHKIGFVSLAGWFEKWHKAYCKFVKRLQTFIVRMVVAAKLERQRLQKLEDPFIGPEKKPRTTMPTTIKSPGQEEEHRHIVMRQPPRGLHKHMLNQHSMLQIHRFLSKMKFQRALPSKLGWSWLEVFLRFDLRGGRVSSESEAEYQKLAGQPQDARAGQEEGTQGEADATARAKDSIEELLKRFKKHTTSP